ncbi:MAG: ACP S-malonyltransferase [Acidimicrobiia bacterium]
MRYAVLFPGQGSQHIGMGEDVFAIRPDLLGESADRILGWSLREACLNGSAEDLTRTERAQPALYAVSYALFQELSAVVHPPLAAGGHSLGEYTALAAAGAFTFADGLALVAARGAAMQAAAGVEASGMAALLGADVEAAETMVAACRAAGGKLWIANLNAPGQVVVAGAAADLEWVVAHGRDFGIRRAVPLDVAGAFHSPLMAPAAEDVARALESVHVGGLAFPVLANATAAPHGGDVVGLLIRQLVSPVRFAESITSMAASGAEAFIHVGPGDVTAGMVRRCAPDAEVIVVSRLDQVGEAAHQVRGS